GHLFDVVKELQNLFVRAAILVRVLLLVGAFAFGFGVEEAQRAEERRRQKFPAALFAVEINVKQIARVELRFIPGTAIGDDAERMERLAVRMLRRFKREAGRAVELADDDAFGAVDED